MTKIKNASKSLPVRLVKDAIRRASENIDNDIRNVNNGGCGIFAEKLIKFINSTGHNDAKIRVFNYDPGNISRIEEEVINNNRNRLPNHIDLWNYYGVYFVHVAVEWKGRIWDCSGSTKASKVKNWQGIFPILEGTISLDAISKLNKQPSNWNSVYDRSQTPKMYKLMRQSLNLVKKEKRIAKQQPVSTF